MLDEIRALGYTVTEIFRDGGPDNPDPAWIVYRIEGYGLSTMVFGNDDEQLASIADPALHEERVKQSTETPEQTRDRWLAEGKLG